ncbi:Fic family protein [Pedobacter jeongneungensis]|uniref:Fic family protein n=1 Tax=Pedobacter jeongneungensis TaxID=947309 RepID=UPI00046B0593|nr:Fic family protein [Pedobacter jeongneungensis]
MLSKNLLSEIKEKSDMLNSLKPLSPENQAKLDKKFRLEFNFNSNHLEGNTLTYGETELLLIFDQTEGTHDYREYQEMQAHDVALRMIQEEAAETERPLLENFIRNLNEKILVKPFWKDAITADGQSTRKQIIPGEYKKTPNSVRLSNGEIFHYTAPSEVANEIAELVAWFNENNGKENPVLLAALLHYRFVRIHPFDDGNGRTARLLMNYVFAKNNLPLVVIKSEEKKDYLATLNRADAGDLNAFVEYIGKQLLWSLDLSIKAAKGENIDEDDDLDKELELLKQELNQVPNEFEQEKTNSDIANVIENSIVPLFREINSKIEKIKDLFVRVDVDLQILQIKPNGYHEDLFFSAKDYVSENSFEGYEIKSASINIICTALKKTVRQKNIYYKLRVDLADYNYRIYNDARNEELIILPYKTFLSKYNIDSIAKLVMTYVINEIKSATNLNN